VVQPGRSIPPAVPRHRRRRELRALLAEYHVKDEAVLYGGRLHPLNLRGRQEGGEIIPTHDLLLDQQLGQRREDLSLGRQRLADSLVGCFEQLSDLLVDAPVGLLAVLSLSHRLNIEEERLAGRLERRQPQSF